MKQFIVLFSLFIGNSLYAETWYAYCVAVQNDVRYCSEAEAKTGATEAKCMAFAQSIGTHEYDVESGTDLAKLEAEMGEHCDQIKAPNTKKIFACQYAKHCKNSQPKVSPLASRVFVNTKAEAIKRCATESHKLIRQRLKEASVEDCFFRLVVNTVK